MTKCGHVFCWMCIERHLSTRGRHTSKAEGTFGEGWRNCPVCFAPVHKAHLRTARPCIQPSPVSTGSTVQLVLMQRGRGVGCMPSRVPAPDTAASAVDSVVGGGDNIYTRVCSARPCDVLSALRGERRELRAFAREMATLHAMALAMRSGPPPASSSGGGRGGSSNGNSRAGGGRGGGGGAAASGQDGGWLGTLRQREAQAAAAAGVGGTSTGSPWLKGAWGKPRTTAAPAPAQRSAATAATVATPTAAGPTPVAASSLATPKGAWLHRGTPQSGSGGGSGSGSSHRGSSRPGAAKEAAQKQSKRGGGKRNAWGAAAASSGTTAPSSTPQVESSSSADTAAASASGTSGSDSANGSGGAGGPTGVDSEGDEQLAAAAAEWSPLLVAAFTELRCRAELWTAAMEPAEAEAKVEAPAVPAKEPAVPSEAGAPEAVATVGVGGETSASAADGSCDGAAPANNGSAATQGSGSGGSGSGGSGSGSSSSGGTSSPYYFYQSADGRLMFLHPFTMRCLAHTAQQQQQQQAAGGPPTPTPDAGRGRGRAARGRGRGRGRGRSRAEQRRSGGGGGGDRVQVDSAMVPHMPLQISARVAAVEDSTLSEKALRMFPFLKHLPVHTEVVFVQLDLRGSPLLSRATVAAFRDEFRKRSRSQRRLQAQPSSRRSAPGSPRPKHSRDQPLAVPAPTSGSGSSGTGEGGGGGPILSASAASWTPQGSQQLSQFHFPAVSASATPPSATAGPTSRKIANSGIPTSRGGAAVNGPGSGGRGSGGSGSGSGGGGGGGGNAPWSVAQVISSGGYYPTLQASASTPMLARSPRHAPSLTTSRSGGGGNGGGGGGAWGKPAPPPPALRLDPASAPLLVGQSQAQKKAGSGPRGFGGRRRQQRSKGRKKGVSLYSNVRPRAR